VRIFIDSFSGDAANIKPKERTVENLVLVLKENPKISTWDFSENPWLHRLIKDALEKWMIKEAYEPYPWHRYVITDH